jgi:uncharacterized protein YbcI
MSQDDAQAAVLAEVGTALVRLYKEQFGRGPTRSRAAWAGRDTLVVTLEDSFTPAERTLAGMGEHQRLREMRLFLQHATEPLFRQEVGRLTGREVRAFVSGVDAGADVSSEVFYLVPRRGL